MSTDPTDPIEPVEPVAESVEPVDPDVPLPDLSRTAVAEPLPLCVLLDGHEIATLHGGNPPLESSEYTVITLPVSPKIRASDRMDDGRYVIGLQVVVPPGLFRETRIIDPRRGGNPLDNALGMLPAVRLVVRIDRLSAATQAEIRRQIEQATQNQVVGAPDA